MVYLNFKNQAVSQNYDKKNPFFMLQDTAFTFNGIKCNFSTCVLDLSNILKDYCICTICLAFYHDEHLAHIPIL